MTATRSDAAFRSARTDRRRLRLNTDRRTREDLRVIVAERFMAARSQHIVSFVMPVIRHIRVLTTSLRAI